MISIRDRARMIAQAAAIIRKKYKSEVSEVGTDALSLPDVWISTGSLALDRICRGINPGGLPIGSRSGRCVHIAGEWSTGKSVILDHLMASTVRLGGLGSISETEGSRDPHFPKAIGLDLDLVTIHRPSSIEKLIDMWIDWHELIRDKLGPDIPICSGVDSLDSTEAEKTVGKGLSNSGAFHYGGGRSEALGAGLRKIVHICSQYPTTFVMLNQTREKVGGFSRGKTTPGGAPPRFYASLEIMLRPSPRGYERSSQTMQSLDKRTILRMGLDGADDEHVTGRWVRAKVTKTKVGPTSLWMCDFFIDFRKGIHKWAGLAQRLWRDGMIEYVKGGKDAKTVKGIVVKSTNAVYDTELDLLRWIAKNPEWLAIPVDPDGMVPPAETADEENEENEEPEETEENNAE